MEKPQITTIPIVQSSSYDNVGALIRALHENGTNINQLRTPLEDLGFRRDSPRSSLPSVTISCLDDGSGKIQQTDDHSSSSHHNNILAPTARRLSHFHFGLRRFSNSNSVRKHSVKDL